MPSPWHAAGDDPNRSLREGGRPRGLGEKLAGRLPAAAADLEGGPGCELYLANRQVGQPDVIWVTELWRSQHDLDASLERIRGSEDVAAAMALVENGR